MASASDHRAHAALQPADCLILLPQRLPAAVETSIVPAHYPAECTQSDAFLQPSLRARKGRANSNSFSGAIFCWRTEGLATLGRHTSSRSSNRANHRSNASCAAFAHMQRAALMGSTAILHSRERGLQVPFQA